MRTRTSCRIAKQIGVVAVCLGLVPSSVFSGGGGGGGGNKTQKRNNRIVVIKNISPAPVGFVPALVSIPTVEVGDAGNAATNYLSSGTSLTVGAVPTPYRIGVNEVSVSQYTTFLNAVASVTNNSNSTIVSSLYPAGLMGSPQNVSGITRAGAGTAASPFVYSPSGNATHPVAYVSWFSAARFANWMHNGATNGADTEVGAYTLAGKTNDGTGIARNQGAKWWIPSEDEWYKAAYYKGAGANAGYWGYPTKSDSVPRNDDPTATNQANSRRFGQTFCVTQTNTFDPAQNYLTPCSFFTNSPGPYGTFDQGGNLDEWTDTSLQTFFGNARVFRGGSWSNGLSRNFDPPSISLPKDVLNTVGFRLARSATVPGGGGLDNSVVWGLVSRPNETQLVLPGQVASMNIDAGEFTVFARALHSDPSQVGPETTFPSSTGQNFRTFLSVLVTNGGVVIQPFDFTPKLDAIANPNEPILEDSPLVTIPLSGIAALGANGLPELPSQAVRVTAQSLNTAIIPNPVVNYQSPNSTGSLTFRPIANAPSDPSASSDVTVPISVLVENAGFDQNLETAEDNIRFARGFTVTVRPVNDHPTLNQPQPRNILLSGRTTQKTIFLSGISAGGGESQPLRITASSSDTNIVPHPVVTYTSPQATGSLLVTRVEGRSSFVPLTVTVTVEDGGLDLDLSTALDNRSVTRTFNAAVR